MLMWHKCGSFLCCAAVGLCPLAGADGCAAWCSDPVWRSRSIYAFLNAATATTTLFAAGRSSLWHLSFRGARARGSTCRPAPSKTALPTLPPTGSSCGPATATQRGSCSSTSIARLTAAPGAPCARGTTFRVVPLFATPSGLAGQGAVKRERTSARCAR